MATKFKMGILFGFFLTVYFLECLTEILTEKVFSNRKFTLYLPHLKNKNTLNMKTSIVLKSLAVLTVIAIFLSSCARPDFRSYATSRHSFWPSGHACMRH